MQENKTVKELKDLRVSPAVIYYFDYLGFLHKLIVEKIVTPYWFTIDDIIFIANNSCSKYIAEEELTERFLKFPTNRYLTQYANTPTKLAEDIVKNGYYVPLLTMQNKYFINGSHRVASLISYHQNVEPIQKIFLCLSVNKDYLQKYNSNGNRGLELKRIEPQRTVTSYPRDNHDVFHIFDSNGGMATTLLFDYNQRVKTIPNLKPIIPAECLNNRLEFDNFIGQPFSEKYLRDIEKHYSIYLPFDVSDSKSSVSFYME